MLPPKPVAQAAAVTSDSSQRSRSLRDVAWAAAHRRVQRIEEDADRIIREQRHALSAAHSMASQGMLASARLGSGQADAARSAAMKSLKNEELVRRGRQLLDRMQQQQEELGFADQSTAMEASNNREHVYDEGLDMYRQHRAFAWESLHGLKSQKPGIALAHQASQTHLAEAGAVTRAIRAVLVAPPCSRVFW